MASACGQWHSGAEKEGVRGRRGWGWDCSHGWWAGSGARKVEIDGKMWGACPEWVGEWDPGPGVHDCLSVAGD